MVAQGDRAAVVTAEALVAVRGGREETEGTRAAVEREAVD